MVAVSARSSGVLRMLFGALLIGTNLWVVQSVFEPVLREGGRLAFVFVSASFRQLAIDVALSAAALVAIQWLFVWRRRTPRSRHAPASADNTRHLTPLWWTALSLAPLGYLLVPAAGQLPAISYVLYDLRWMGWLAMAAAIAWRLAPKSAGRFGRSRWAGVLAVAALVIVPVTVAVVATPRLRFSEAIHGDEPKYLRYCENFYQGLGFDVSAKKRLTDPGADVPHVLGNLREFSRAVREEAALLPGEVRRLMGAAAPPRLVASEPGVGMFFSGKHPGTIYQLHNPGISFILFPSYYIDRRWTGSGLGYQNEFPADLPALNVMLLILYAAYGLALYAMLRGCGYRRAVAWGVALLATIVLPAGAFAFQIYPEIAAGSIVCLIVRRFIVQGTPRVAADLACGLLAGFLPWLHVRFAVVPVVMAVWMLVRSDRPWRARLWFSSGAAAGLAALCLYTFRLTGSFLPSSTYGSEPPLSLARMSLSLPGFAFDRLYGIAPHAPIYLLALPGIVLLWTRRRSVAGLLLLLLSAIVLPAAGHGYWAGGATPGRYLVAAIPLVAAFLAESANRWLGRRGFAAAFAALTLVSVETAVRYDWFHQKEIGPLVAPAFAGWRPNLLFPSMGMEWSLARIDVVLLVAWCIVAAWLVALPLFLKRGDRRRARGRDLESASTSPARPLALHHVFAALAVVGVLGLAVTRITGASLSADYLVSAREARERALTAFAQLPRCAVCYSSEMGAVEPTRALGNDPGVVVLQVIPPSATAGRVIRIRARPRSTTGEYLVGDVAVDLGDGSRSVAFRRFGDLNIDHTYASAGTFRIHARFSTPDKEVAADLDLIVRPPG